MVSIRSPEGAAVNSQGRQALDQVPGHSPSPEGAAVSYCRPFGAQ
jgi:hypothetical protein